MYTKEYIIERIKELKKDIAKNKRETLNEMNIYHHQIEWLVYWRKKLVEVIENEYQC